MFNQGDPRRTLGENSANLRGSSLPSLDQALVEIDQLEADVRNQKRFLQKERDATDQLSQVNYPYK